MKPIIKIVAALVVAVLGFSTFAQAQEAADPREQLMDLYEKAMQQLETQDYPSALASYEQVLVLVAKVALPEPRKAQIRQIAHYNSACALALTGKSDAALDQFSKAVEEGFHDWAHIDKDSDLDSIREDAGFKKIIASGKDADRRAKAKQFEKQRQALIAQLSTDSLFPFDFDLTTIDGKPIKLSAFQGKVVLVDLWGTWCPPCRAEVPHLIGLYEKYNERGFTVVGLNRERVEAEKAAEVVKSFVAEHNIPYPCAVIDNAFLARVPNFRGFPTMLLIDREGRVRLKKVGFTDGILLEGVVEHLLGPSQETKPEPKPEPDQGSF